MGLFSFVGKALKTVSKVAGFIPGIGGTISKVTGTVGGLLDHKRPMAKKILPQPQLARGNITQAGYGFTPQVLRATPILPGGAVSTPSGIVPPSGSAPPASFGGRKAAPARRRRKAVAKRRTTKRRATKRRLKFGSPAWRKKYMKRR